MVKIYFVEKSRIRHENPIITGTLNEHPVLLQSGRFDLRLSPGSDHIAGGFTGEHIPSDFIHENDLFLPGDFLRFGKLVESPSGLEDEIVCLDEFLNRALSIDGQDLKPGGIHRNEAVFIRLTYLQGTNQIKLQEEESEHPTSPTTGVVRGSTGEGVEHPVEFAVEAESAGAGSDFVFKVLQMVGAAFAEADGHDEVVDRGELIQLKEKALGPAGHFSPEIPG